MTDAYIAGLFDGEGSIVITKPTPSEPRRHALRLTVRMTCEETIRQLAAAAGCGTVVAVDTPRYSPQFNARPAWRWAVGSAQAEAFLRRIAPYAVTKAKAIKLALEFRALKMGHGNHDPVIFAKREELREALSAVNHGV